MTNPICQTLGAVTLVVHVFLFLHTGDFWRDYYTLQARGVHFVETPRTESYGTVAVFEDIYRNRWDLLQLTTAEV